MVNFQELIVIIRRRGHSMNWIATQVGTNQSTISMIAHTKGRVPNYHLGKEIVDLEQRTRV